MNKCTGNILNNKNPCLNTHFPLLYMVLTLGKKGEGRRRKKCQQYRKHHGHAMVRQLCLSIWSIDGARKKLATQGKAVGHISTYIMSWNAAFFPDTRTRIHPYVTVLEMKLLKLQACSFHQM